MEQFKFYLDKTGEVGYVEQMINSVVYVAGLPSVHAGEVIVFENGDLGQVLSLDPAYCEVLLFSQNKIKIGVQAARSGKYLEIGLSEALLGKILTPLGSPKDGSTISNPKEVRQVDAAPLPIIKRKAITKPLETGISIVDLTIPIALGQRELVIGDRNTGKTSFLFQVIQSQATKGTICIYAAIGKKKVAIKRLSETFKQKGIEDKVIIVASSASDPSGLIFITPYTAMTIAEYFRDRGVNTLVILDDLTNHAKNYREISLLTRRFPGRNSYPGDIFYIHSRLLERAGSFESAAISCLPVAESVMGDLSGYVQTNLMAMTDGHLYFDSDLMNQGKFPPINPFLSVTRVGLQAQSPLFRDVARTTTSFLVNFEKLKAFMHFGAELTENVRRTLSFGERLETFFGQESSEVRAAAASVFVLGLLWAGFWPGAKLKELTAKIATIFEKYQKDSSFKNLVDDLVATSQSLKELTTNLKLKGEGLA